MKAVIVIVANGHMYIPSDEFHNAVAQYMSKSSTINAHATTAKATDKSKSKKAKKPTRVVGVDPFETSPWEALTSKIHEHGCLPLYNSVFFKGYDPHSFAFRDPETKETIKYVIGDDLDVARRLSITLGQGDDWKGAALGSVIKTFYDDRKLGRGHGVYGCMNPSVHAILTSNMDGASRGMIVDDYDIREWGNAAHLHNTVDMCSAYPYIMRCPMDTWGVPDMDDEIVNGAPPGGHESVGLALFEVEADTTDARSRHFFGKSLYWADRMKLRQADRHGIRYTIRRYYPIRNHRGAQVDHKAVIDDIITRITSALPDDDEAAYDLIKHVGRVYSGAVLGLHSSENVQMFMTTDMMDAYARFVEEENKGQTVERMYPGDLRLRTEDCDDVNMVDEDRRFEVLPDGRPYMFLRSSRKRRSFDTNAFMYAQLTNWVSVQLYDMMCERGRDDAVFVNVDSITFSTPAGKNAIGAWVTPPRDGMKDAHRLVSDKWGRFRGKEHPTRPFYLRNNDDAPPVTPPLEWKESEFHDSNDASCIYDLLRKTRGCAIFGKAGTGKSHTLKVITERGMADNLRMCHAAPTHKAKNRFGPKAVTIAKLVGVRPSNDEAVNEDCVDIDESTSMSSLRRVANAYDLIIIDEASMISIDLWHRLVKLGELNPELMFVIAGDHRQLGPVYPGITGRKGHHMHASFVKWLCHETLVTLTVPKRSDDTRLFELVDDIHEGRSPRHSIQRTTLESAMMPKLALAYLNAERVFVNEYQMNRYKPDDALFMPISALDGVKGASQARERSQDMWVFPGLPVACAKTSRGGDEVGVDDEGDDDEGVPDDYTCTKTMFNGELCQVVSFDATHVVMSGERVMTAFGEPQPFTMRKTLTWFQKHMIPAYACTIHKVQGDTIKGKFAIIGLENMSTEASITALTRATHLDNVLAVDLRFVKSHSYLMTLIKRRLQGYVAQDVAKNLVVNTPLTVDHVTTMMDACGGVCGGCGKTMVHVSGDKRQLWTLDRIDNNFGHDASNVRMVCHSCNVGNRHGSMM